MRSFAQIMRAAQRARQIREAAAAVTRRSAFPMEHKTNLTVDAERERACAIDLANARAKRMLGLKTDIFCVHGKLGIQCTKCGGFRR
jgi:hypothetical protein